MQDTSYKEFNIFCFNAFQFLCSIYNGLVCSRCFDITEFYDFIRYIIDVVDMYDDSSYNGALLSRMAKLPENRNIEALSERKHRLVRILWPVFMICDGIFSDFVSHIRNNNSRVLLILEDHII